MRRITKVIGIVLLFVGLTYIARVNEHRYDFKETLTKVSGKYGYGSGNVVESGKDYSLILTNKHVCEGTNVEPIVSQALEFMTMITEMYPKCSTFKCLMKSDARFGPNWLMLLMGLQMNNINLTIGPNINDFVVQLQLLAKKFRNRPLLIRFNNLPVKSVLGKIHAVSKYTDLCLVKIPVGNLPVMLISDTKPKVGDKIITIGNPMGATNVMVDGYVGDEYKIYGNTYQQHSAEIYSGQSGSSTFNTKGEMVGVNTLSRLDVDSLGYMIPLIDVKLFLSNNLINRKIRMKL